MVKAFFRTALSILLLVGGIAGAAAKEVGEYRLGDPIGEDIVTPVALLVVDPAATEAFKEKEAQRIPVVFRFDQTKATTVDLEIRETFTLARSNFVRLLHSSFHHTRLEEYQLQTAQFAKLLASFKRQNRTFPLALPLAEEWALGRDGLADQMKLLARVRQAMEQPIRSDNLTNALKIGSRVTLVPVQWTAGNLTLAEVKTRGTTTAKTNLLTLSRARAALLETFGPHETEAARFAARSLQVNTFVEAELTLAARAQQTEPLLVVDDYQAGQVVARRGQLVDRKILAALNQIQEKTMAGRLQQQVAHQTEQTEKERSLVSAMQERNQQLLAGLITAGALLLIGGTWLLLRRKSPAPLLPAVAIPPTGAAANLDWQQRAIVAEEKAARAQEAIRSGVVAQLTDQAVSSLASQRSDLLDAQRAAAAEMAELEQRLTELQVPLQDRLRAYEGRIADLERALAAKGEENRELIRAKIQLMRQQLEVERAGSEVQFN